MFGDGKVQVQMLSKESLEDPCEDSGNA